MKYLFYADISDLTTQNFSYDGFDIKRKEYVESISNEKRKRQSYYVWVLLLKCLKKLNLLTDKCDFYVDDNGRWFVKDNPFYFSLSHSENIVAVCISNCKVALDVEQCSEKILKVKDFLIKRNSVKPSDIFDDIEFYTTKWTEYECKNKLKGDLIIKSIKIKDRADTPYIISVGGIFSKNLEKLEMLEFNL